MKSSDFKTAVLYLINYAVSAIIFVVTIFYVFKYGNIVFPINAILSLVLFIIDTIFVEKWYHFLLCTLPYAVPCISAAIIVYISYNNNGYDFPGIDSLAKIFIFALMHLCSVIAVMWSVSGAVYKYKTNSATESRIIFAVYSVIIGFCVLISAGQIYLMVVDSLFKNTIYSLPPMIIGICLIVLLILLLKPNKQE